MENSINDRLKLLIEALGFSSLNQFDKAIGVSRNVTNSIIGQQKSMPGAAFLIKIKTQFPNINLDWLLMGNGDMFSTPKDDYKKLLEEKENLAQENSSLKNELQGSLFALSLVGRNANFQPVSWEKPVSQPFRFFANSLANVSYSNPISA